MSASLTVKLVNSALQKKTEIKYDFTNLLHTACAVSCLTTDAIFKQ